MEILQKQSLGPMPDQSHRLCHSPGDSRGSQVFKASFWALCPMPPLGFTAPDPPDFALLTPCHHVVSAQMSPPQEVVSDYPSLSCSVRHPEAFSSA